MGMLYLEEGIINDLEVHLMPILQLLRLKICNASFSETNIGFTNIIGLVSLVHLY